jgi:hypothetical protein
LPQRCQSDELAQDASLHGKRMSARRRSLPKRRALGAVCLTEKALCGGLSLFESQQSFDCSVIHKDLAKGFVRLHAFVKQRDAERRARSLSVTTEQQAVADTPDVAV